MANEVVALILWLIASFFIIFASCDHGPQIAYIIAGVSFSTKKTSSKNSMFMFLEKIDSWFSCNDCLFIFVKNIIQLVSKWYDNNFSITYLISYLEKKRRPVI